MTVDALVLDAGRSRLAVRTRATGMLARLAHDLELVAPRLEGRAELEGGAWSGELRVAVAAIEVAGVLKGDRLDAHVLSASDRGEILKRMRDDAFRGAAEVFVQAYGASPDRAELTITIGSREARASAALVTRDEGTHLVASGRAALSLKALGSREIKAPLGAFSVKDEIEVRFDLTFTR